MLDQKVFTNSAVAEVLNGKYVSMKVNAEKGEGKDLAKEFGVTGFPTAVVVDPKTKKEVERIVGYAPPEQYLVNLKKILSGDTFAALRKKAEDNPKDLEAQAKYAEALDERGNPDEIKAAWKKVAALDPDGSKGKAGKAALAMARLSCMEKQSPQPMVEFAKKYDGKPEAVDAHKLIIGWMSRSPKAEDRKLVIASYEYLVGHDQRDAETLNNYAWYLVEKNESLDKALKLATEAVEKAPKAPHILDTAATCLQKLGKKEEAIQMERKAIEAAPEEQKAQYKKRLEEIEK